MVTNAGWLDAAGALYLAGTRAKGAPLDAVVAKFLRDHRTDKWGLDDGARGFVVDTAQGMWRARRRVDAALKMLPFEATRGAMAALYLVGARGVAPSTLPIDRAGAGELATAWTKAGGLGLDVRSSLPSWLADTFVRVRGKAQGEALCLSFLETPPTSLRANALKTTRDDLISALGAEEIDGRVSTVSEDGVVLVERANVHRTKAFRDGLFEVQDEGSQLVSRLCEVKAGMVVVDGCAGAGGKTLHLAALMEGKGTIHAFDVATHRLESLRERAKRAGAHNVRVHSLQDDAGRTTRKRLKASADVVLVDAPCTGTGVLRRNPDTSWRLVPEDVARLVEEQAHILDAYAPLVKPGGRLVYATCSLLDDENAGTIASFRARHPELTPVGDVLALDPLGGTDGFFACALARG